MPTRAEIDTTFLARHQALTERFYAAKRAGPITPTLQTLFDKAHGYLSLVHMRDLMANGIDQDYYVDEVWSDEEQPRLLQPGTKLRSQEIAEALAGAFKLKASEIAEVLSRWGVSLG